MGHKNIVWQKHITTAGNAFLVQELEKILAFNFIDNDFLLFAFESLMILRAL